MNNVWTSIALRAPCAVRRTRNRPLLELFNGYAKRYESRWLHQRDTAPRIRGARPSLSVDEERRCFGTTALLSARQSKPPPPRGYQPDKGPKPRREGASFDLRYQPNKGPKSRHEGASVESAQRVASHTEGVDPFEQEGPLTWRDYDPAGGMPLPEGELSQPEVNAAFGSEDLDADTGNYILSVLHWRRLSGALIDQQLTFPKDSGVTRDQAARGLEYLRRVMPDVDEEANGQRWVDEENERLQGQLQARAIEVGLYKRAESEEQIEEEEPAQAEPDQGTPEGRARTSESVLETTRKANEARYAQELKAKELAAEKAEASTLNSRRGPLELSAGVQPDTQMIRYGPSGISISAPQSKAWLAPVERKSWVKYYEEHAQILKDNTIPQLSLLQRLGPSFLVLLATIWLAHFLSENYTPPPTSARIWPDYPPSVATLAALTLTLAACFLANRIPPLWRTYSKFFTLVPVYPYAVSILGATFRHDTLSHLLANTFALWLMGLLLHEDIGRGTFLAIFLASGAAGGFTSLTYLVLRQNWNAYVFGCSGAVLGVVSAVCTLKPHGKIKVSGWEVPIAAWVFLAVWTAGEVVALRLPRLGVDHAGHVGGLVSGFAWGMWLRAKGRSEAVAQGEMLPTQESDVD